MMTFFTISSAEIIAITAVASILYLAILSIIIISERNKNKGDLSLLSLAWIVLSIIFPIVIPIVYFIAGNVMLKKQSE